MVTRTMKCTRAAAIPRLSSLALFALMALHAATLRAEEPGSAPASAEPAPTPAVHHAPVSSAFEHDPIAIEARLEHPEAVRWFGVVYRTARGRFGSVPFQRSGTAYIAVIPADVVEAPGLGYTIELELVDGKRVAMFASRAAPYPIHVLEDRMNAHERALFERLGGRRSVVTTSAEYVSFGATRGNLAIPCAPGQDECKPGESIVPEVEDRYWRVEAGYTYRPLRTVAEFSLRGGVVRGISLVQSDTFDVKKYEVGLNYGAPTVRFRITDAWHIEAELLASITEVGFSVGLGSSLLIGDPYGSHVTLGFETIGLSNPYFGTRFFSRVTMMAGSRVRLSPVIEVTDMPHAESFGVRLLGDVGVDLGRGFTVSARGGYQARKSVSGGPSVGGSLSLAF